MAEQSILVRFIRGTLSTAFGNMSLLTLGLVGTMIATRRLPEDEFGVFVLYQVIAMFLMQFSSFGLDMALAKYLAGTDDEEERRLLFNTAWWWRFITIPVVSLIGFALRPGISALFGEVSLEVFLFIPAMYFFDSMIRLLKSGLQGYFRFGDIGIVDFLGSLSNFLLILLLVLVFDLRLMGLIYARVLSLGLAFAYAFIRLPVQKRLEMDRGLLRKMLWFGVPLQANDILSFIYTRIDTLVIGALLGPAEIAYYEIARRIPDSLLRVYEAFRSVYFPFISRFLEQRENVKAARLLNASSRLIAFVSMLGAVFVMAFGGDFLTLLFPDRYLASAPAFTILTMTLAIMFVGNILGTTLVAVGDTRKPAIINTIHSVVSVVASLLLIPPFGIAGAAFAVMAGNIVSNPINLFFVRRHAIHARLWDYAKPVLIALVVWAAYALIGPETVLARVAFILAFLVLSGVLGVFTLNDLAVLGDSDLPLPGVVRSLLTRRSQA